MKRQFKAFYLAAFAAFFLSACTQIGFKPETFNEAVAASAAYNTAIVESVYQSHELGRINDDLALKLLELSERAETLTRQANTLGNTQEGWTKLDTARAVLISVERELAERVNGQ